MKITVKNLRNLIRETLTSGIDLNALRAGANSPTTQVATQNKGAKLSEEEIEKKVSEYENFLINGGWNEQREDSMTPEALKSAVDAKRRLLKMRNR